MSHSDDTRVIIYDRNMFIIQATGVIVTNVFFFTNDGLQDKLECLSQPCFYSFIKCLCVKPNATKSDRSKHSCPYKQKLD